MDDNVVQIGDRIQLSDFRGTVRFIGSVQNQSGRWIGIDWDDVSRGKHNGVIKGVRYFQTDGDLPSASFVPYEKLQNGVSLVSAIQARYTGLQLTADDSDYDDEEMFVSTTSNKSKRIELVGKTKVQNQQKKTHLLQSVDVSGACITHTGSLDVLSAMLVSLQELNVSFNFIYKWKMVLEIIGALPKLKVLNLSGNPFLRSGEGLYAPTESVMSELETLILNECCISWTQAIDVIDRLCTGSELQVCSNQIKDIASPNLDNYAFHNLESIDFAYNNIQDWNEVCCLSSMPKLKKLNLSSNPIKSVQYHTDQTDFFASLETLLLGDCLINTWDSIGALNLFPNLKETRTSGNPLLQSVVGGGRFEIVARVHGLVQLNGSRVSPQERIDCERRYISLVANSFPMDAPEIEQTLNQLHPRYFELINKHGVPSSNASSVKQTGALKESVVEVKLSCHAPSCGSSMGSQTKKLSVNMSLGTLRTLIEKLFNLPKDKMKLYLKSEDTGFPEDITDIKDDKRLRDIYIVVSVL
eukprot:g6594.t1